MQAITVENEGCFDITGTPKQVTGTPKLKIGRFGA